MIIGIIETPDPEYGDGFTLGDTGIGLHARGGQYQGVLTGIVTQKHDLTIKLPVASSVGVYNYLLSQVGKVIQVTYQGTQRGVIILAASKAQPTRGFVDVTFEYVYHAD